MSIHFHNEVVGKPKASSRIVDSLTKGINAGNKYFQEQEESSALERLGLSPEVARVARGNPKILEALIGGQIQQGNEAAKQKALSEEYELKKQLEEYKQKAKYGERSKAFREIQQQLTGNENPSFNQQNQTTENLTSPISPEPQGQQKPIQRNANTPPHSQEEINAAALFEPQLANAFMRQNEEWYRQKRHEDILEKEAPTHIKKKSAESDIKIAENLQKEADVVRKNLPLQRQAIADIKASAPNITGRDYLAEKFHFEPFRSSAGAKLKTAIKDFFLSDIGRVGRPNQWVEQQLADALPTFGRNPESNISTALGLEFKVDIADKLTELESKLAEQDRGNFGYVKGSTLRQRANEAMEPWLKTRNEKLALDIQKNKERFDQRAIQNLDPVPKGTPLTEERAIYLSQEFGEDAEEIAKELGYQIMSDELYEAE